ncbi:MAG: levR [Firmicutes bacterium]|nr:levR [Bacillota bacterium]
MNRKELIYNTLLDIPEDEGIDTQSLASILHIGRANISHELNNLCKEGKVFKSSGRPVRFFAAKPKNLTTQQTKLDILLKDNISLRHALEQAKAAILYPPKGMVTLLLGETGVGKSMFACLMQGYAVEMGVKQITSPFIIFNCADYTNNPQLLTAQLFGVKRGTYTGAETDKIGLIKKADGGILFLDEVHRLPPEGQEALFTFLDTGQFRRMGDDKSETADVLIITATTENPNSALLKTFTRRIPMIITIPALRERTLEERLSLIKYFFKHESIGLNRDIFVSLNTMRAFLSYNCTNNIGQLKSDIQLVCAKAFSEFLTNLKEDVRINSYSLPIHIKEGLYKEKEHRILWNKLVSEDIEYFKFGHSNDLPYETKGESKTIYDLIEQKLDKLKAKGISDIDIENILEKDITRYFEKYISGISEEINKKNLLNILGEDVLALIDKVVYHMVTALKRNINHNVYTALSLHINTLINRITSNKPIVNPQLNKIKQLYPEEFMIALEATAPIQEYLNRPIPEDEAGYLTLFLLPPEEHYSKNHIDKVKIILIAHGKSTASSMAEVANELLCENYVIAINSPIEVKPSVVLDNLRTVIKENFSTSGFLLLVDMGSLTTFAEIMEEEFKVPVKAFSLTSTLHVIEATRKALLGFSVNEIYKDLLLLYSYIDNSKPNPPVNDKPRIALITACLTGEGGSVAIKSFLNNNLKYDKDLFEIISLNCLDKKKFKEYLLKLQKKQEILFIISSYTLDLAIPQYNMHDVISMKVMSKLQEAVDNKSALLKMGLILKENIENLDGEELYNDIVHVIKRLEARLSITLSDENLIGLILHLSFTISRLKQGKSSISYPDKDAFINKNIDTYTIVKENFIFLYNKYFTEITDNEICYIINFFRNINTISEN